MKQLTWQEVMEPLKLWNVTAHFIIIHSGMSVRMNSETFHHGTKSVQSAALDGEIYTHYKFHKTSFGQERTNEIWNFPPWNKARTCSTAPDYEMHELSDAFSYSNKYFALNGLILILSQSFRWDILTSNLILSLLN